MSKPTEPLAPPALILVTGCNGFLASWTVHYLLEQGFRVRGTVRSLKDEKRYAFVRQLGAAHGGDRLEFAQVELEKDEGWDEALKGVDGVLHMAMRIPRPSAHHEGDPAKTYLAPALKGVEHVLTACRNAGTVRRFVFTSSVTAVTENFRGWKKHEYTPDEWNTTSSLKHNAYAYAKTQAEKRVIEWMKSPELNTTHMEYVTLLPNAIMGPPVKGNPNPSETDVNSVLEPLLGHIPFYPPMWLGVSDVRDLALAHIAALTVPEAAGQRFILSGEEVSARQAMMFIKDKYPQYRRRFPHVTMNKHVINAYARVALNKQLRDYLRDNMSVRPRFYTKNVKDVLGITIRPAKDTIEDSATWFVENGRV